VNQMFEIVERLTLQQRFRLIEISHETNDSEIRAAALALLFPPVLIAALDEACETLK
jgi:hypothetical protein